MQSSSSEEYDTGELPTQKGSVYLINVSLESGLCSIDFYMAAKDPFRVAPGKKIPYPWPHIRSIASAEAKEIADELRDAYEKVLLTFDIKLDDARVVGLSAEGGPPARDTLIIDTYDMDHRTWKDAATEIQKMLDDTISRRASEIKIRVEIRNHTQMYQDWSSVIKPNSVAHMACMEVEAAVYEQVKKSCPGQWRAISYLMRGPPSRPEDYRPTIMIRILPGTQNFWEIIEKSIVATVEASSSLSAQIYVEMLPGYVMPLISQELSAPLPKIHRILDPRNGSSIGPRGTTMDAGTLGAWVDFQGPGKAMKERCFLTCHHVISPGDDANKDHNDRYGIGLEGREIKAPITVDCPAPFDATATKTHLQWEISQGGDEDGEKARIINEIDSRISAGGIGFVIHASGNSRNRNGRRMDWALVRVHLSASSQCNKPPPVSAFSSPQLMRGYIDYKVRTDEVVSKAVAPIKGDWVTKLGRCGITVGEVNAMESRVFWEGEAESYEVEIAGFGPYATFAERGDSGSMVINLKKEWVGMICWAVSSRDMGLITTTQELMDDIKDKTGGTISLV